MAIAASLNVNLTATSGQFTATMSKAGSSLAKLSKAANNLATGIKSFFFLETLKKGLNFITHAVMGIEELKKSAADAGFTFSAFDLRKFDRIKMLGDKINGSFAAMKLQLLVGLAPAIAYVSQEFERFSTSTVGGFTAMELTGKATAGAVIIIGKAFQTVYTIINEGVRGLQVGLKGIVTVAAKAAELVGTAERAKEFNTMAENLGRALDMSGKDLKADWESIFSWPDAQKAGMKAGAAGAAAMKAAIQAPSAIGFGSQESALFDFKRRETQLRASQQNKQKLDANNPQVAVLNRVERVLMRIERNTATEPDVYTG